MLRQNYAMEYLPKSGNVQQPAFDFKKSQSAEKTGFPQFKEFLNGALSKPQMKSNLAETVISHNSTQRNSKAYKEANLDSGRKPQFKSYRDVRDTKPTTNDRKAANKSEVTETGNCDKETKDKVKTVNREGAVADTLAQVLGISAEEMEKLLKAANIRPEELIDEGEAQKAVNKLAELLSLDSNQKSTLAELTNILKDLVNGLSSTQKISEKISMITDNMNGKIDKADSDENWVKVNNVDITVVDNTELDQKFKSLMAEMKAKLNSIAEQLQKDSSAFRSDLAESLKAVLLNQTESQKSNITAEGSLNTETISTDTDEFSLTANKASNETEQESGNESQSGSQENKNSYLSLNSQEGKAVQTENSKLASEAEVQFNSTLQAKVEKTNVHEIPKYTKEINVPKGEIIEQVVSKAKVVLTADKSEMVMDLKPESLGKLSLKVVTERGLVVAKFIAENQQVKEALEANMQLLKDSLEKQGLSVQGFSVSVRQDSYRGSGDSNQYSGGAKEENSKTGLIRGVNINDDINLEKLQKSNPYAWGDSQINLTA